VTWYARAAGLDEALVLSIAWPMIEEAAAIGPLKEVPEAAGDRARAQRFAGPGGDRAPAARPGRAAPPPSHVILQTGAIPDRNQVDCGAYC
jgi:hypothetical protein